MEKSFDSKGALIGITAITPLRDRSGTTIGLINMGLKFNLGEESEAVKFATSVGGELAVEIPSKLALFDPAAEGGRVEVDGEAKVGINGPVHAQSCGQRRRGRTSHIAR